MKILFDFMCVMKITLRYKLRFRSFFFLFTEFSAIEIKLAETVYNKACMNYKQTSPQPRSIYFNVLLPTAGAGQEDLFC